MEGQYTSATCSQQLGALGSVSQHSRTNLRKGTSTFSRKSKQGKERKALFQSTFFFAWCLVMMRAEKENAAKKEFLSRGRF